MSGTNRKTWFNSKRPLHVYITKKDKALFNQLKSDLQSKNISWESIEIDNKVYDLYFPQKNLCFFVVDEMLYNERTIDKQYFSRVYKKSFPIKISIFSYAILRS